MASLDSSKGCKGEALTLLMTDHMSSSDCIFALLPGLRVLTRLAPEEEKKKKGNRSLEMRFVGFTSQLTSTHSKTRAGLSLFGAER